MTHLVRGGPVLGLSGALDMILSLSGVIGPGSLVDLVTRALRR
jgi:hypothetical protein